MNLNIKEVWKVLTTASNEQLLDMFRKIAPAGNDTVSNILPMGRWQELINHSHRTSVAQMIFKYLNN